MIPKLHWVAAIYEKHIGRRPASVVDVGAGGGHALAAAQQAGLDCEGFELSRESRRFAQEAFGLCLAGRRIISRQNSVQPISCVTHWGLLEYVSNPPAFMEAARKRLKAKSGMLIVEVPRLDALGTVVQARQSARCGAAHGSHIAAINCFSDLS